MSDKKKTKSTKTKKTDNKRHVNVIHKDLKITNLKGKVFYREAGLKKLYEDKGYKVEEV
jgi:hypothetical protein